MVMTLSRLLHALICCCLLTCHLPAWAKKLPVPGVTGGDDRTINDSRAFPWSAIGRLNITTGGFCTATVIDERRVLTAAHCLWNHRTARWYPPCALHFLAGYRRGEYEVHAMAAKLDIAPGFKPGRHRPAVDWAVVTLDRDILDRTGRIPLGETPPEGPTRLVQAGYSRDHRHVLTVDRSCRRTASRDGGRVLLHDCDATFGDSGSPLLHRVDGRFRLVGVHVAISGRGERARGVAVASRAFISWINNRTPDPPLGRTKACAVEHNAKELIAVKT